MDPQRPPPHRQQRRCCPLLRHCLWIRSSKAHWNRHSSLSLTPAVVVTISSLPALHRSEGYDRRSSPSSPPDDAIAPPPTPLPPPLPQCPLYCDDDDDDDFWKLANEKSARHRAPRPWRGSNSACFSNGCRRDEGGVSAASSWRRSRSGRRLVRPGRRDRNERPPRGHRAIWKVSQHDRRRPRRKDRRCGCHRLRLGGRRDPRTRRGNG
mmetsp:Transcript_30794/g.65131  ORF Transcript_30794/g.65131 Transcript_30794/m.65131 type:complete len:209 (+) Transcript_30794:1378-2004(+)